MMKGARATVACAASALACLSALVLAPSTTAQGAITRTNAATHPVATTRRARAVTLNQARLGTLQNYRATLDDNGFVLTYRVHSATDWEEFDGKPTPLSVNVNGWRYLRVPHISGTSLTYVWTRSGRSPTYDVVAPYPGYVRQFIGLTHVAGAKLVRGAPCRQAGVSGHWWGFAAALRGALYPHVSACVADRTGWLLNSGTAALTVRGIPSRFVASFQITGIDDVGSIAVPH